MRRSTKVLKMAAMFFVSSCTGYLLLTHIACGASSSGSAEKQKTVAERMFGKALPILWKRGDVLGHEFVKITIDDIFNDLYGREKELDIKTRELCTITALTSLGRPEELQAHLGVAFKLGWTHAELRETMILCSIPAGWPATAGALRILTSATEKHNIPEAPGDKLRKGYLTTDWTQKGNEKGTQLFGEFEWKRYLEDLSLLNPGIPEFVVKNIYGKLLTRTVLDERTQELCLVAGFASQKSKENLRLHIIGALNSGATSQEVKEVLFHVGIYAGQDVVSQAIEIYRDIES